MLTTQKLPTLLSSTRLTLGVVNRLGRATWAGWRVRGRMAPRRVPWRAAASPWSRWPCPPARCSPGSTVRSPPPPHKRVTVRAIGITTLRCSNRAVSWIECIWSSYLPTSCPLNFDFNWLILYSLIEWFDGVRTQARRGMCHWNYDLTLLQ